MRLHSLNILPVLLFTAVLSSSNLRGETEASAPPADATATATATATAAPTEREFQRVADVKRGDRVVLRGEVTRITDEDEFILTDATGRIRVYIGWKNDLPVKRGDQVIVEGRADDDAIFGTRPEIYARVLELPDGTRIQLTR